MLPRDSERTMKIGNRINYRLLNSSNHNKIITLQAIKSEDPTYYYNNIRKDINQNIHTYNTENDNVRVSCTT
jgi:hypothetical protein